MPVRHPPPRGALRNLLDRPHARLAPSQGLAGFGPPALRPTLALVVNLHYPENTEFVAAARVHGAEADCTILLADAYEFVGREEAYERLLVERRIDGLLIATCMPTTGAIAALARHHLPLVLANRRIPWLVPGVAVDDEAGTRLAVEHLTRLGHRRIAYIGGPGESDTVERRLVGFRRAVEEAGLYPRSEYIATSTRDQNDGPARAIHQMLNTDPRPTAVVLWTVGDATGALHAIRQLGLRVPEDISVVAFNDAPQAAYMHPPLTVVRMPLWELAEKSIGRLFSAINGCTDVGDVVIRTPPELIERASTAPPPLLS